jgi:hypothetical protein
MEFEYIKKLYYNNLYNIKDIEENIYLVLLSCIGFFLPFVLGHPQLLVGIMVNAMLIIGATYLKGHKLLPIILLPSLGVLAAGAIFGTYTVYLLYLVPFIWLGNAVYVYVYKHLNFKEKNLKNNFIGIGAASVVKEGLLFGVTFLLVKLAIVPSLFLTAMGILQLVTALLGGVLAIGILKTREKFLV